MRIVLVLSENAQKQALVEVMHRRAIRGAMAGSPEFHREQP